MLCCIRRRPRRPGAALGLRALRLPLVAWLAAAGPLAHAVDSGQTRIELREQVQIDPGPVRLGDVAYIRSRDLDSVQRLIALPLGQAPRPGLAVALQRAVLEHWVQQHLAWQQRGAGAELIWSGAQQVRVAVAALRLPGQRVSDCAQAALTQWLQARGAQAQLRLLAAVPEQTLAFSDVQLRARPPASGAPVAQRMSVWVDLYAAGRFVKAVAVDFAVQAQVQALVARSALAPGALLDPGQVEQHLERQWVDATQLRLTGTDLSNLAAWPVVGERMRVRRALQAGQVLLRAQIAPAPEVERGSWVQMSGGSGAIALTRRAQVLQDGWTGQAVRVRLHGVGSALQARVLGPGQVEVLQ